MEKLNTTGEWESVVAENHRKAVEAYFEKDLQEMKVLCRSEGLDGKDREMLAAKYSRPRYEKLILAISALLSCVGLIVLMCMTCDIPEVALPAVLIGLLLAGFMVGWHFCAAIRRR